ncbi:Glycosyl hydrolases family 18 [Cryptosporangium aurantiacum]|uniref:Glycosyl hydrolases family 18 n=2 Tax=Cryptosporangium aurantiacum TaxID=134849 RepID=A0A1M7N5L7_9ACTN|nr:Glycosyl hydrolases family 18 [Cryptosporangium aurantiacum]
MVVLATGSVAAFSAWGQEQPEKQQQEQRAAAPSPKPPQTGFEPYVDMGYYPPFDLAGSLHTAGVKQYVLGFIVAGDGCTPTWDGEVPLDDEEIAERITQFRAEGGMVRISFGGAAGAELASVCDSVSALTDAYQRVIDTFSATALDFDVEGNELSNTAAHTRRAQAIAALQKHARAAGKTLNVAFTLPVNPSGFTATPIRVLNAAAANGAAVDVVNVMAMDYGRWAAPDPEGMMGTYAIQAMTNAHATVRKIFGLSPEEAWRRIAVTPLIGVNVPATEVFSIEDAVKVTAFAREKRAAYVSMWSITRDRPCPEGVTADADSDTCAGNAPTEYAFTRAFLG